MTSTKLRDRPADHGAPAAPAPSELHPVVYTGRLLGLPVIVEAARPLPVAASHLLDHLNGQWDVRRRHSDIDRVNQNPNVMLSVSRPTLALLDNALAAIYLARLAGLNLGACQAVLDHQHEMIGADPAVAAVMARLAPATAADLLADTCLAAGLNTGSIRVGAAVHVLGHPVEAWLRQVTGDITHAIGDKEATGSQ